MKFSIIIPHCNEGYLLDIMFDSMYKHFKNVDFEIILVDDGSDYPEDLDFIQTHELAPKTKVFLKKWLGAIQARNFWASQASGDWFIFFDAHMYFVDDILEKICSYIRKYPERYILQTVIWNMRNKQLCSHALKIKYTNFQMEWCQVKDISQSIPSCSGACTILKKDIFQKVQWFHPFFLVWGLEDCELSIRLRLHGYDIYIVHDTISILFFKTQENHFTQKSRFQTTDYSYNSILFAYTCFSGNNLHRILQALHKRFGTLHEKNMDDIRDNVDFWNWLDAQKKKYKRTDDDYFVDFHEYLTDFWKEDVSK